ncbi:MAG TPA: polysulfide reductase NrfD [Fimbriimonadaceae bacterium]|nr:hydrogenase [Armatimonadota bacterium]HCM74718.1 hydrogenase [Armatimonadota bacterium]HRD30718.1 polysulfide reductase NrfD [Fimbriimonadaceae bacterium]HRE94689.1 polysulfide reductase NrfD [Fimbriimonadaceae bacterium]HRI74557.1 polysulfide reductase NrfD [Fimbriimonadaceae bacterium]
MAYEPSIDKSLLEGEHTEASIDAAIADIVLDPKTHTQPAINHLKLGKLNVKIPAPEGYNSPWFLFMGIGFLFVNILLVSIAVLVFTGIGIWGNNQPVGWGFDIINFVWWIGIGHAGTLISAILLLLRQKWRNSINRFAEAMTIFAVMCAGIYPLLHTGRPWAAYWLFPYPNVLGMWPNFRSPLVWDVFAVSTYMTVSILFWFVGLIPDFATLRDRAKGKIARVAFGVASMGWKGSAKDWVRYEHASLILAGISTPLVLSVHTIVSFDFAMGIVPGWNVTIFPPYFVAGAVFAGFAMVITLMVPIRKWYKLEAFVTMKHFDWMAKVMLATGLIVVYGYAMEIFYAIYSGVPWELSLFHNRWEILQAPYSWAFWLLILFNGIIPQILWIPKMRQNLTVLMLVSASVSIGMWFERYVIIPISLTRDYLPSSYGYYTPTGWDFAMFFGSMGLFVFLLLLFIRFLPMINIFEIKELKHQLDHEAHAENGHGHGADTEAAPAH